MKNFKYIILAVAGLLSACSDYLDVKPVGKMIPTEVAQFENLLNNTNTLNYFMKDNNNGCFYAYMGDNLKLSENQANYQYISTFPNLDRLAGYIFYEPVMSPLSTPMCWSYGIYRPVGYFNNVIDGVGDIDSETEYAKGVIAQARAGRAWIFMNAALTYGPMYDPNGANDAKVIPYRTNSDPTVGNGDRNTTAEMFALAKADLDYACENCPASLVNPSRADKACAYALRAEYYMYVRDWAHMLEDCQTAWELSLANNGSVDNMIYNLNDFYYEAVGEINPEPGCSPEYYMTLRGPDTKFEQTGNRENLLYRYCPVGQGVSNHYPSNDWQANFDQEKDLRWKLFAFIVPGYSTTVGGVKHEDGNQRAYYRDGEMNTTCAITHPLLLLMKAEAEARTNALRMALDDLNLLRKYRYSNIADTDLANGSTLTQDQLLNEILNERRREQPICSYQRTVDLKRYAFDSGKPWSKATITHKIGEKAYSKPITDKYYQSLPIDNAILEYNPQWGIAQTETSYTPYDAK